MLKCRFGRAVADMASPDDYVQVTVAGSGDPQRVPQRMISEIIQPRVEEILSMVKNDLRRASVYHTINGGVVISGGGSQLAETGRLASQVLDGLPVRVGAPRNLVGLADSVATPPHATGVGLAIQAAMDNPEAGDRPNGEPFWGHRLAGSVRGWWEELLSKIPPLAQHRSDR